MEVVYEQVIGPILKFVTGQITKHLGYVTCSTKHVNVMTKRMEILKDTSVDVKNHMDRNKRNNKEIPASVPGWLDEVEKITKDVESISSNDIGCLNMKTRYHLGRKACKGTERIQELIAEKITWTDAQIPTGTTASSTFCTPSLSSIGGDGFKSREKPFNDALKFLQQDDNKSQVIALCGMGGIGKTTMMEQLKTVANDKKMFHWIVKVVIGTNPNIVSVQNDIALCLGGESLREATKTARAESLCKKFQETSKKGQNKILVILDDVWQKIELSDIGLTSPLPNGIKLLLTSRKSNICSQIAAVLGSVLQEVRVNDLKEEEAQNFFSQITGVSKQVNHDKYLIGCRIVKRCGCLPLAIKLIASTLKSQEDYVWRDTLNHLENNEFDDEVQAIISISYEHIKKEEDKEIFLHCGLFPEDANIPIEHLTRYAWGLNLLKNVSTLREARDRINTCVRNLLNASLLINGDHVGCVKMHDLVLSFVLGKTSKSWITNYADASEWVRDERSESCERISLTCTGISEFPRDFKFPNVSLLQLMDGDRSLKFPEEFYENMENLKVLAYYNLQYPLLTRSLQCSSNLKSLCLDGCSLSFDHSFVGDLVNLEMLSFAYCGISKLSSAIGNLKKLKLLDLTGCKDLHVDDGVFQKLVNLEELFMKVSWGSAIRFTDSNLEELKMLSRQLFALVVEFLEKQSRLENFSFKKLDKFKIAMGCYLKSDYIMDRYSFRNTLNLVTNCNELLDCKINELFKKTEELHLSVKRMISLEDILANPYDEHSFCNLRDLEVSDCAHLKYLFPVSVARGLRQLERLIISSCSVLEALVYNHRSEINSADEIITFEKLNFLFLEKLPKLLCLFLVNDVVELPQLVELKVDGLPNFSSIYPDNNNISALLNSQVKIANLEILDIRDMWNLKHIWASEIASSDEEVSNASMLREIIVYKCDSLVNLFPTNPMRLLNHLEMLEVGSCGSIEVILNIDLECVGKDEQLSLSSRLRSIKVMYLDNLREVWRIKGGENNSNLIIHGFEAVKRIEIEGCKRFRNVFTPTNTNTNTNTKFDMKTVADTGIDCVESGTSRNKFLSRNERDDNTSAVAFPSNLMRSFPCLEYLSLSNYNGVEVVFEVESGRELVASTSNQQPLLPRLEYLYLFEMKSMSHVWKWNKFLIFQNQSSSFHNLSAIAMSDCHRIKYLFSPLMAKLLSNLREIKIIDCAGMEEVVSNRDDDKDEDITTSTNFFPHLQILTFKRLKNLERIGGGASIIQSSHVGVVPWSLCQYSRKVVIDKCESLREVFETHGINNRNYKGVGITNTSIDGRNDAIDISLAIPRLGNINMPKVFNLKKLRIGSCNLLKHVFTFSTLESLRQLEKLTISKCNAMEEIVKKENGEQRKVVEFPRLKSLILLNLPNLKGFFLGINEFHWPLLETVTFNNCPQMIVFTSSWSRAPELKYIRTNLGKHSLECGLNFHVTTLHQSLLPSSESTSLERLPWSFHNLIEIDMENELLDDDDDDLKCIIPSNVLLQLQKLERIRVDLFVSVEEVFKVEPTEGTNSSESPTVVEIPNLRQVELKNLWRLKHIWQSHHYEGTVLLLFPNLKTLSIFYCVKLEHLFTSSMVASLPQLQDLHVSDCQNMKVIVKEEEDSEFECDAKVKQIVMLPCLKSLKLEKLLSLKGFWLGKDDFSFPSLDSLEIKRCPHITVFTKGHVATPALNIIDTSFGRCYATEDINSFMETKQQEGFQF